MIECQTRIYNSSIHKGKYSKIIGIKKKFLGIADWHNTQLSFSIISANSLNGYKEKKFFISCFSDETSSPPTLKFIDLNSEIKEIECVYTENNDEFIIYCTGGYDYVPLKLKINYVNKKGKFMFYNFEDFIQIDSYKKCSITSKYDSNLKITLNSSYSIDTNRYSDIRLYDNTVKIKCVINSTSSYANDYYKIGQLDYGTYDNKLCHFNALYEDTDGNVKTGFVVINASGEILLYKISNLSKIYVDIEYKTK